jgi:hypothetical protein
MSAEFRNPAVEAFVGWLGAEKILGEVLIQSIETRFELRHVADKKTTDLKPISIPALRSMAQVTSTGEFRPLKSAPTLQTGWKAQAKTAAELELALNSLYPGAIADWFALRNGSVHPTNYREFTNRQTGMYRITQMLSEAQASRVIRACCDARFCLKCRFWTVESLAPDAPAEKSEIPCLEPCAILLESARKSVRTEQAEKREQK